MGKAFAFSRPRTLDKDVLGHLGAHVGVTLLLRDEHTCSCQTVPHPAPSRTADKEYNERTEGGRNAAVGTRMDDSWVKLEPHKSSP